MLGQGFVQAFLPGSGRQSSRIHRDEPVRNRSPRQLTGCTSPGHSKARRSRWPQAKPQPPSRVTRPAAERCCAAPALPAGGERRGARGGGKSRADRSLPPGEALGAPPPVLPRLPNRPGSLRVAATDPATPSSSRGAARWSPVGDGPVGSPDTPRPGCSAERTPRSHSAEGRRGSVWPREARPALAEAAVSYFRPAAGSAAQRSAARRRASRPAGPGRGRGPVAGRRAAPPPRQGWAMR